MRILFASIVLMFATTAARAQETEVTAAYQFNHFEAGAYGFSGSTSFLTGASLNANVPVNQWFGITGDAGWTQKSASALGVSGTVRLFTYGGGPQFTYRKDPAFQPYLRMIFGAGTATGSVGGVGSATSTAFMFGPGGGLDARISHHLWLRGGVDYLHGDKQGVSINAFQAIAGIQFRFGGKTPDTRSRHSVAPAPDSSPAATTLESSGPLVAVTRLGISASSGKNGAEIRQILSGSLAAHSGLQVGDVVNLVGGKKIRTPQDLAAEIAATKAGETIEIGYLVRGMWQAKTSLTITAP